MDKLLKLQRDAERNAKHARIFSAMARDSDAPRVPVNASRKLARRILRQHGARQS